MTTNELNEALTTGVDAMDREHALELQLVRAIQKALATNDRSQVPELLQQLEDFTNAHFLGEQLLMRMHAYPGFQAHQEEHDHLMNELVHLASSIRKGDPADSARQVEELERWLITHIQSEDQTFAEYLKQQDKLT
jgi:hemerythrin